MEGLYFEIESSRSQQPHAPTLLHVESLTEKTFVLNHLSKFKLQEEPILLRWSNIMKAISQDRREYGQSKMKWIDFFFPWGSKVTLTVIKSGRNESVNCIDCVLIKKKYNKKRHNNPGSSSANLIQKEEAVSDRQWYFCLYAQAAVRNLTHYSVSSKEKYWLAVLYFCSLLFFGCFPHAASPFCRVKALQIVLILLLLKQKALASSIIQLMTHCDRAQWINIQ